MVHPSCILRTVMSFLSADEGSEWMFLSLETDQLGKGILNKANSWICVAEPYLRHSSALLIFPFWVITFPPPSSKPFWHQNEVGCNRGLSPLRRGSGRHSPGKGHICMCRKEKLGKHLMGSLGGESVRGKYPGHPAHSLKLTFRVCVWWVWGESLTPACSWSHPGWRRLQECWGSGPRLHPFQSLKLHLRPHGDWVKVAFKDVRRMVCCGSRAGWPSEVTDTVTRHQRLGADVLSRDPG